MQVTVGSCALRITVGNDHGPPRLGRNPRFDIPRGTVVKQKPGVEWCIPRHRMLSDAKFALGLGIIDFRACRRRPLAKTGIR